MMVANSDGDGVYDREFFLGHIDPHSSPESILYWNQEFRSTIWGHMTLLNLKHLVEPIFTGFKHTTHPHDHPMNADIADHVHDQQGHVNYTHPAHNQRDPYAGAYTAKELPIDVALGKVDSIDVMSNQNANMEVWYRLLNCGLRLPASAGTDCFLNRIPSTLPGAVRVYVHCPNEISYASWVRNLQAGRTFVTNGPMLRLTVNGQEPGSEIKLQAPAALSIVASVVSRSPIDSVELVVNGRPENLLSTAETAQSTQNGKSIRVEHQVKLIASSWVAIRVKNNAGAFAHTRPVYVYVADNPIHSSEDAAYFLAWIDRLRGDVRKRNQLPPRFVLPVEEQLAKAAEYYRRQTDNKPK
ncbi:MAG: CehA/McbA family metallohydrolase [Pirellula sp.]